MLNVLNFLRFVFALLIFTHHKNVTQNIFLDALGPCGVSFFMILSGFVMAMGYLEKSKKTNFDYKKFYAKRVIRLYPLHFLCLLGYLVLNKFSGINKRSLICNFLLMQSWIPIKGIYFGGNAVSWCLSDLMFCYFVFPIVVRKFLNFRTTIVLFCLYALGLFLVPEKYVHAFIYINPIFRFVDFYIGILIYKIYKSFENKEISFWVLYLISVLVFIGSIFLYTKIPSRFGFQSLFWIPNGLVILTFSLAERKGYITINNIIIKKLGEISFTFYMIHQLGIGVIESVFNKLNFGSYTTRFGLEIFLIVFVSIIVNRFYEVPIKNLLGKKIEK